MEQNNKPKPGLMLYGFDLPPPLDVKINWTEMYDANIPAKSQEAWIYYLLFVDFYCLLIFLYEFWI